MTRHDIICISSIDWDFIWQGHQEIMSTLASQGHRVLFIENTGVRSPRVSDLARVGRRLRNWWRGTQGFRQERENLFVYAPIIVPLPYSRIAQWANRLMIMRSLRRWMAAARFDRPIVWTFLPTPLAVDLVRTLDPKLCVYHCLDDLSSSSVEAQQIVASEQQLFREADLVFVTSEKLRQRALIHAADAHLFPSGVSLRRFESVRDAQGEPPADMAQLERPIVGYVGGLHQWVDQDLIVAAARRLPHVSFALIGPEQTDVTALRACPNIHLLGTRPHDDVPRYLKAFDVGIVPYRLTEYTAHVYPAKLNEYLAMGLPVVTTDLAEIRRFNSENSDPVAIASDADSFVAQLLKAVADAPCGSARARRIEVARRNSWSSRIAQMSALIEQTIGTRQERGDRWEVRLRRLYRRARRRSVELVAAVVAAYVLIFQTPFIWSVASPLRVEAPPRAADAIVVFGGGVGESGEAGGGYQERVQQAVDLYHAGYAPHIVFSSGFRFAMHEAEVMQTLAVARGVPPDAITLEERAANTRENVLHTDAILEPNGWRTILLVSSPYHMRRALLTWRRAAPAIVVIPTPVKQSLFYAHSRGASLLQIRGILQEYVAIAAYWWRGWI
jgi:uncharacterized SAM-binding protein YcdF (DUF218 family)/glycosyltransferase involved in cell wall biosynthesis